MKRGRTYDWIPLWRQKWLMGSTRIELEPAERSVWIDLLCLAGNDDGWVRANAVVSYGMQQLAGMLVVPVELLESTIEKCIKYGKIERCLNGTLRVTSWEDYALTPRHKKRFMSQNDDTMSQNQRHYTETETETETETKTKKKGAALLIAQIISHFNEVTGQKREVTSETSRLIAKLVNKGHTLDEFKRVIEFKTADFMRKDETRMYIRPATFFAESRFEDYLVQSQMKRRPQVGEHVTTAASKQIEAYARKLWADVVLPVDDPKKKEAIERDLAKRIAEFSRNLNKKES